MAGKRDGMETKFSEKQGEPQSSVNLAIQRLKTNPLTEIETEICDLLFIGKTAKQIANIRTCSYRTIERHRANIKIKLGGEKLSPYMLLKIKKLSDDIS